jgi:Tfp pilus assembly protein PilE
MAGLASIPLAFFLSTLTLYQLYVVAAVNGVFTVFFEISYQSYLPALLDREDLVEGNSKLQTSASAFEPHRMTYYLQQLAALLHTFTTSIGFCLPRAIRNRARRDRLKSWRPRRPLPGLS